MIDSRPVAPLRVVVLTSGNWVWETVAAVHAAPGVQVVGVIRGPAYRRRSLPRRVRQAWRRHGPLGIARLMVGRVAASFLRNSPPASTAAVEPTPGVPVVEVPSFGLDVMLPVLDRLRPDLGILDGTPIIGEAVFSQPRLGMINLHCGRLPSFRGSPPVFWELFEGATEVGVTIHRVSAKLDGGAILMQEVVSLDPAPAGDPVAYAAQVWQTELRPVGIRLLAACAAAHAAGPVGETPQPAGVGRTYRPPTFREVTELRRRVRQRRANADAPRKSLPS